MNSSDSAEPEDQKLDDSFASPSREVWAVKQPKYLYDGRAIIGLVVKETEKRVRVRELWRGKPSLHENQWDASLVLARFHSRQEAEARVSEAQGVWNDLAPAIGDAAKRLSTLQKERLSTWKSIFQSDGGDSRPLAEGDAVPRSEAE